MGDSANELICFLVWPLRRQQWILLLLLLCISLVGVATPETQRVLLRNCLVGALPCPHYVMRSFLLCGVMGLQRAQYDLTR